MVIMERAYIYAKEILTVTSTIMETWASILSVERPDGFLFLESSLYDFSRSILTEVLVTSMMLLLCHPRPQA